jgi:hypothetical protein
MKVEKVAMCAHRSNTSVMHTNCLLTSPHKPTPRCGRTRILVLMETFHAGSGPAAN